MAAADFRDRLLAGLGRYTDDRKVADVAHMAVVRAA